MLFVQCWCCFVVRFCVFLVVLCFALCRVTLAVFFLVCCLLRVGSCSLCVVCGLVFNVCCVLLAGLLCIERCYMFVVVCSVLFVCC